MNDAEYEAQKQRLRDLSHKWVEALGLGWWNIQLEYARDNYEPAEGNTRNGELARCKTDWRYGHACITWNMLVLPGIDDEELELAFLHELMHIFLNEMRWARTNDSDSLDHEERVASTLTKAFLWFRDSLLAVEKKVEE